MIGYFTINEVQNNGFVDWNWLLKQKAVESKVFTKHVRFENPIVVKMNGHENKGIIYKPE
jgi:hypothetical protein